MIKRRYVLGVSLLASVFICAMPSYSWFEGEDESSNEFLSSANYDVGIYENFTPTEWEPGKVITKEVAAGNAGDIDAIAMIYVNDFLSVEAETTPTTFSASKTSNYYDITSTREHLQNGGILAWSGNSSGSSLGLEGADGNDFTPTVNGTYIFKHSQITGYSYDGYYYYNGKYYELSAITSITANSDGTITKNPNAKLRTTKLTEINHSNDYYGILNLEMVREATGDYLQCWYYGADRTKGTSDDIIINTYMADNWEEYWTFDEENFIFYYNRILKANTVSEDLFVKSCLDNSVTEDAFKEMTYSLGVGLSSIQIMPDESYPITYLANTYCDWTMEGTYDETTEKITWN